MNPVKVFFSGIGHFFQDVWDKLKNGNVGAAEQELMQAAAKYLPEALRALKTINSLAPNKAESEIVALGQKYQLSTAGVDLTNESSVQGFLLTAAEKEFQSLAPMVPTTIVDFIVQSAFAALAKAA